MEPQSNDIDDATLVQEIRRDPQQFDALYRRYVARVYRYCYARTNNHADAEDLTAQIFLKTFESLPHYRERYSFAGWLFGIARNTCAMFHRANYSHPHTALGEKSCPLMAADTGPEQAVLHQELIACLRQALQSLPEDQVEALHLRFWGALNAREIGVALGRKTGAIKMSIWRAIERLRKRCLDETEI